MDEFRQNKGIGYSSGDFMRCWCIDSWLMENGATNGEKVLIEHG